MKTINFFKTALLTIALFVCGNVGAEIAYNANFANQTGASGSYSPNVTISLENQEWYASYCYFGSNEFRLGHNKTTGVVPSKFLTDQPQGASIEMLWDIANVTKISVLSEKSYGTTSDWYIFESTDGGSNWTQVATGAYTEGATWEYTTTSPKSNARYAFVIKGTSSPRAVLSTITIEQTSTSSVSTPTFSPQTGKYTQAQNVTINCATAEASIYYTLDKTEPSAESTLYNGAINISSTTTLKAIAIKDGESSAVATATYTFPTEVDNIAAFNQAENNDFVKITKPITVTYINGANVYAQDESGSMLIYDFNFAETEGLTNGSIINNIAGENTLYNGAPQMKNVFSYTLSEYISIIDPTTVETLSTTDVHKYVKLEDAQFNNSYSFTESSAINANLSTHGNIVVRNNFRNFNMDVNSTDKYDIVGFVSVYNNAPQIYPVSIVVTTPSITVSTNSLAFETVENNQTKDLTFTVNGANLSENATLAISGANAGYFTCTPTSITPAEDGSIAETSITVTYQPTATGEHAATLTITCGDLVKEIALTGTCISPVLAAPVAAEATAITANGFTANWQAVENATSYEVNVWKETNVYATDLIISEYVEGSSNNKYIEIYNGTGSSIDLSDYKLQMYANGSSTPSNDIQLEGTLEHNTCKVYKNSSANIYDGNAENNAAVNFNGDDAIALYKISTESYVDIFGVIGNDPGSAWTCEKHSTSDKTLRRKSTVLEGISTNPADFTTLCTEWEVSNKDDVSNLGQHTMLDKANSPIANSPFTVTEGTSLEVNNLTAETTYYYNVVAKAEGYTASEASNTISVTTTAEVAEPTITITGDDLVVETEGMYSVALGDTKFSTKTSKTFTLTATGILEPIKIKPEIMSGYFTIISSDSEQASIVEEMDFFGNVNKTLTFTPDETGEINAVCTISNRINSEFADYGVSNGEEMMQMFELTFGTPLTEQWGILYQNETTDIRKIITVSLTLTEESTGTGLCNQPVMEGISFNGQEIINSLNLDVVVYNAIGQMIVRSNENINMSSYPAGVYVIKAANGESMKIVK